MFSRRILLPLFLTATYVHGLLSWSMIPIKTTIKNNSEASINLFCQSSSPVIDRYSKETGWCYDKWIVLNLEPEQEKELDLWIFQEDQSKLKVSVLASDNGENSPGDEMILSYFRSSASSYIGDATFYSSNTSLKTSHSGNLECNLEESGSKYSAKLVVY